MTLTELASSLLDIPVESARTVSGGDINDAYILTLRGGEQVFVKCNNHPDAQAMFESEAEGLRWLDSTGVVNVPEVIAIGHQDGLALLILDAIVPGGRGGGDWGELGTMLACLHLCGEAECGFHEDNFIATLSQSNQPEVEWARFYIAQRLEPMVALAVDTGKASTHLAVLLEQAVPTLLEILATDEPPSRLHGDLWTGNVMFGQTGEPWLIDPAVYAGEREIDLAMLELFGSPPEAFYHAYNQVYPIREGYEERRRALQLYPILVHANLFGPSYVRQAEAILGGFN